MNYALLLLAGSSKRFNNQVPKQFYIVKGKPVYYYPLKSLNDSPLIDQIIILTLENQVLDVFNYVKSNKFNKVKAVISGGDTRNMTVSFGLKHIKDQVKEEYNSEVKKGYIISQSVTEGKDVPKGTTVELVVSLGIEQITMINVDGKTYEEASEELEKLGFKVEKLSKENTGGKTSGTVASATIKEGTECDKGTLVRLQVWTDPETTTASSDE